MRVREDEPAAALPRTSDSTAHDADRVLRVLIVTYEYPPLGGGGGVIFRDLAEELSRSIEVTVLTSGRKGLAPREVHGNLEILRVPVVMRNAEATASLPSMLSFFPSSLHAGRRLLREHSFDLVHSSFAVPSGPSGLLLARHFRLPHVLSLHGGDVYDPSKALSPHRTPGLKQTVRWVIHSSDRVVAQSSDTLRRAVEIYGERKIDCIPLAARQTAFKAVPRAALGLDLSDDDLVLVTVGRIIKRKGLDQLLGIASELDHPRFKLVIVGEGPDRAALEARAKKLGIAQAIRFAGFVSEERKWQILAASDLYVSTSLHEGFGIVFLEAMMVGLPVLCYDRGGQADFVSDDVGRLLPVGDTKRFGNEVRALGANPEQRARLGANAKVLAAEYSVGRYAQRYLDVYRECLEPATSELRTR
jgi:glycosyltransferase involved in cell wall biosynthesis